MSGQTLGLRVLVLSDTPLVISVDAFCREPRGPKRRSAVHALTKMGQLDKSHSMTLVEFFFSWA